VSAPAATEFGRCRERLERAVGACRPAGDWAGNVSRTIAATIEFAAADPAAALTLTERASSRWREREPEFVAMVEHFARLLDRGAPPRNPRLPDAPAVVARIARQLNLQIEAGRTGETTELVPDLTFLALMPYLGFAGARQRAEPATAATLRSSP